MKKFFIVIIACCLGCKSGEISCPVIVPIKLRHTSHYRINPVKKSHPVARADERRSTPVHERDVKELASIEEWDCPKPGMNKPSRVVQQKIKANKKKINAYYKNRFRSDSVRMNASISR